MPNQETYLCLYNQQRMDHVQFFTEPLDHDERPNNK
jgi:hypothetical protein